MRVTSRFELPCYKSDIRRTGCRALLLCLLAVLWALGAPAQAAVQIVFHSKDFGASFPHAFVSLSGTVDGTGEVVDSNYGFTVRHALGPSALFGPVQGEVISERPNYVAAANRHFALVLTDEEYRRVLAVIERWRALPQPSYQLDRRNCVTFVAAIASALDLEAVPDRTTIRRPRAFLERVLRANRGRIETRTRELARQ